MLAGLILPVARKAVAQGTGHPWYEVRSVYTSDYGVRAPQGLAFAPGANAFLAWDSAGAVTGIGMREQQVDMHGLQIPVGDARNISFNGQTNSLFLLGSGNSTLKEFSQNAQGLPLAVNRTFDLRSLRLSATQGLTFDPGTGTLYLLNNGGRQLVIVRPGARGSYDGTAAVNAGRVTRVSLRGLGLVV